MAGSLHGLRQNALNLGDAIIIGLSSSGPGQTMAVSLAAIVAASSYAGLLPIILSFIPMIGIAIGYQRLNRWEQTAGATYSWVAKALNPYLGFVAGWMILLYYTVGTTSLTIPAGTYTLQLIAPNLVNNSFAVGLTGALWDIGVLLLAVAGIQIAAKFQWIIAIFEYVVILSFTAIGIVWVLSGHSAVHLSWSWFTVQGAGGFKGLVAGILIAIFMYSGWDAAIYVNEETKDRERNPGRAAISSVVILLFMYGLATFAFQGILPGAELQKNAGNALAVVATRLAPGPWELIMSLVVLTGTVASLQAAVISSSRMGLAMAADKVMPKFFTKVNGRSGSPWAATIFMGGINLIFLVLTLSIGSIGDALGNVVSSLGLMAAIFYALTAAAALWHYRHGLTKSIGTMILGGLLPLVGVIFLVWVIVESVVTQATSSIVLAYGFGSLALGIVVALLVRYIGRGSFFKGTSGPLDGESTADTELRQ